MTHQYGNSGNDVIICRVGNIPEHGTSLHIKVDMRHPDVGLRCGTSVKDPGNIIDWNSKWARTLIYLSWDIYRDSPLHKTKFKYQSWYLTPCCGFEVQKPTQALKSVKGPGNTFDWNPKWWRTLPSLIYSSWNIYRDPPSIEKNQISKLIFNTLLWAWDAETHPGTSVS